MSAAEVLEQAMKLTTPERAALAQELLVSLDGGEGCAPQEWEAAWAKELQARIERYERGETTARPWREVMDEIEKELDEESV